MSAPVVPNAPAGPPSQSALAISLLSGVAASSSPVVPTAFPFIGSDAGGIYIQGGTVHRIPPYGPVLQIMQQITAHTEAASIRDTGIRSLAQAAALTGIMRNAAEALRALDPIRTPSSAPTRSQDQESAGT